MEIRHLAAAFDAPLVAAAAAKRTVTIWDLETARERNRFGTILDFGGHRLALSNDGAICIAGAYEKQGVAAYSAETGELLWQRKDLTKVQAIVAGGDGTSVLCVFEYKPSRVLRLVDGATLTTLGRGSLLVGSPYADLLFLGAGRSALLTSSGEKVAFVKCESWAFVDAAFGPSSICVSEAAGSVRVLDVPSGKLRWRYDPPAGTSVLRVAWNELRECFFGVEWSYERGGGLARLLEWHSATGASHAIGPVPSQVAFLPGRDALVAWDGALYSLADGKQIGRIAQAP